MHGKKTEEAYSHAKGRRGRKKSKAVVAGCKTARRLFLVWRGDKSGEKKIIGGGGWCRKKGSLESRRTSENDIEDTGCGGQIFQRMGGEKGVKKRRPPEQKFKPWTQGGGWKQGKRTSQKTTTQRKSEKESHLPKWQNATKESKALEKNTVT